MPTMAISSSISFARIALAAAWFLAAGAAAAQTPAADATPALLLSPEQKQVIYQTISVMQKDSAEPQTNNAESPGFHAAVGALMPKGIRLKPMPDTLATLIPDVKNLQVAMVEQQVVLVEPTTKTVVAVVTHAE